MDSIVLRRNNVKLDIKLASFQNSPTYPREFFENQPRVTINFPKELRESKVEVQKSIYNTLLDKIGNFDPLSYTVTNAKVLGFLLLNFISENLMEDWTTFKTIIKKGESKPIQLVQIVDKGELDQSLIKNTEASNLEINNDQLLLLGLIYFLPFRLSNGLGEFREVYFKSILSRIGEMINAINPVTLPSDQDMRSASRRWIEDEDYVKIANVLDMFLTKFPRSNFSKLKSVTSIARFKDCTSIGELHFLSSMLKMDPSKAVRIFHTKSLEVELINIFQGGNEIEKVDSFTPYLSGLKLVTASPYSTRVNPCLHHFVSLLGCCANKDRSYKAVCFDETYVLQIIDYCMFIANIYFGSADMGYLMDDNDTKRYDKILKAADQDDQDLESKEKKKETDRLVETLAELKKDKIPAVVIGHFKTTFNAQCPSSISNIHYKTWANLEGEIRPGTMKDFLHNYAKSRI